MKRLLVALFLLTAMALLPLTVQAQEPNGYKETFDNPTLPEWERSRETVVADGVLRMDPGNFALRFGDWSDITLTVKVLYSGQGEVVINYYFRDEHKYGLFLHDGEVILEREQDRSPTPLGSGAAPAIQPDTWFTVKVVVSGGEQQVYVDDALVLTANDADPLDTGAVLLQVLGEATAQFDDLEVRGRAGEGPPPPEPIAQEGEGRTQPPDEQGAGVPVVTAQAEDQGLFEEFFSGQAGTPELATLAINLGLAAVCAHVLALAYIHWGASLTNRRKFAANFYLMTITTAFIILIVRSSVALSLGLVGALSIVRFRTAVKEAEELAYLFFAIGLGIGLGDNQRLITLLALVVGIAIIGLLRLLRRSQADVNMHLTVVSQHPHKVTLEQVAQTLDQHASKSRLLRFDETADVLEMAFLVEFVHLSDLNSTREALKALSDSIEISFLDNKGIW